MCFLIPLILFAIGTAPAASNVPEGYAASRYESLWKRSPFTLSSISEDQNAPTSPFAERYSLGASYTLGTKDYVIVINRANPTERYTVTTEPNDKGMSLVSLSYNAEVPIKTTAIIKQGEESGSISFDEKMLASAATAAAAMPAQMPPQAPRPNMPTYTPNNPPGTPNRIIRRPRIIAPPPGTTSTPTSTPTRP